MLCKRCGLEKDPSCFYTSNKASCKDCVVSRSKKYRENNLEKVQKYDRLRGSRQHKDYLKEYRKSYPKKYLAHNKLNNAIRDGNIENPRVCEICSGIFHVVAHHDDYDKPLQVRWLCSSCHQQWHSVNGEALNAV